MAGPDISVLRVIAVLDPKFGGPSESSTSACLASQRMGVQNTFVFPVARDATETAAPARKRLLDAGVRVKTFGLTRLTPRAGRDWGLSPRMVVWIWRNARHYDIIHIHQTWGLVQVAALLTAVIQGRPSVVTPHESLTQHDVVQARSTAKDLLRRMYVEKASLIVLSSELEAEDSIPDEHRDRSVVIPHPLADLAASAPRDRMADGPLVVGYLGRLHEKKNVDLLIQAVATASPNMRLRIAGDGSPERRQRLSSVVAQTGAADRIEWLGFVSREDRPAFLDSIDVLAMPSRYECFGMAAAEAMARGVATIVSSSTGIAELGIKHECARVVAPTVDALVTALREMDRDRGMLARLARRGADAVNAELSMESYGRQIRLQYQDLLRA